MGRKDKLITINSKTSEVFFDNGVLGIDGENLQGKLIFSFDEFIDGVARLEIELPNGNKSYAMMTKENETYTLPIRNFLTKNGKILLQIVITEGMEDESPIVFKGKTFYFVINSSINAEIEEDSSYDQWIDVANSKLLEVDDAIDEANNLDIEAEKVDTTTTITITKKDGTTEEVEIQDGERGADGQQGIDGVGLDYNWQGTSLGVKKENESEYEYVNLKGEKGDTGTNDYNDLINKPDLSQFITKSVDDLVNYYKKTETYTQTEVNNLIGAIQQFHYEIVQELPETGVNNILYLVPKTASQTNNVYDEYVYANNNFEKIGDTQIDLTNYVTTTQLNTALADYTTTSALNTLLAGKQDTLTAGTGIDITNNVISASGGGGAIEYLETVANTTYTNLTMKSLLGAEDGKWYVIRNNCFISYKKYVNTPTLVLPANSLITLDDYNVFVIKQKTGNNPVFYYFQPNDYAYQKTNKIFEFGSQNVPLPLSYYKDNSFTYSQPSYIPTNNETAFTPTGDYNPSTKKYVDDSISSVIGNINTILATLTTPSNGGGE